MTIIVEGSKTVERNRQSKKHKRVAQTKRRVSFLLVMALCISMVAGFTTTGFAAEDGEPGADVAETQSTPLPETADSMQTTENFMPETVWHNVFFYDAEGNEFQRVEVQDGLYLSAPGAGPAVPNGATFAGWFEKDSAQAYLFEETPVTGELKLYAVFEAEPQASQPGQTADMVVTAGTSVAMELAPSIQPVGGELHSGNTLCTVTYMVDGKIYKTAEVECETLADLSAPTGVSSSQPFLGWYLDGERLPFSSTRLVERDITLYAKFSTNVLVTYLDADGSELDVFEIEKGKTAPSTDKAPIVDTGYEFLYWTLKGSDTKYDSNAAVQHSITLVPKTTKIAIAVFVTQGTEIESQTGPIGFVAEKPGTDPKRMGYTFDGWYTDETYTTEFAFDDTMPIGGPVFIYAKWNAGTANYIVNFWAEKANTDAGDPRDEANRGDYDLLYTGTVEGGEIGQLKEFGEETAAAKWQANASANAQEILYYSTFEYSEKKEISPFGDTVINVFYKRTTFKFTFDVSLVQSTAAADKYAKASANTLDAEIFLKNGESVGSLYSIDVKLGEDISEKWPYRVEISAYNGKETTAYYMTNWSGYYGNGAVMTSLSYLTVGFSADRPVDRNPYNYTAGAPQRTEVVLYPSVATNPYFETRYYYTEISKERYEELMESAPKSVRAWPTDHAIYGGERYYEFVREAAVTAQTSDPNKTITTVTNENYGLPTAAGWPGAAIDGYETIGSTSASACRTKDFQALFVDEERNELNNSNRYYRIEYYMPRKTYDLTLVMNNGSIADPPGSLKPGINQYTAIVAYGQDLSALLSQDIQVTRAKYDFKGWYLDSDFNVKYTGGSMPAGSLTLYAKFEGTEVTVAYSDGVDIVSRSYARDEVLTSHNLAGTPYANVKKGDAVPGKGYFQGWYYTPGSGRQVEFPLGMALTQDQYVLTASFKPDTYTVTFMQDSADEHYTDFASQEVQSGDKNTPAKSGNQSLKLSLTGYTFMGWSTVAGAEAADFSAATSVAGNMTVYPVWRVNSYKVTYDAGKPAGALADVAAMPDRAEATYAYQSGITVAGTPALEGYAFTGWKSSADSRVYRADGTNQFKMPAQNVTLTAQWKPNTYQVTYNQNCGDTQASPAAQTVTVPAQTVGALPVPPTRTGYAFSGWNRKADGTGSRFAETTKVSTDITVYAQWTQVLYRMSFDLNGGEGTVPQAQSVQYNSKATAAENPKWEDHTFLGWSMEQDGGAYWDFDNDSMPAHDVVLYARWASAIEPAVVIPATTEDAPMPTPTPETVTPMPVPIATPAPEAATPTPAATTVTPSTSTNTRPMPQATPAVQAVEPAVEPTAPVDAQQQPEAVTAAATEKTSESSSDDNDTSAAGLTAQGGGGGGSQSPAEIWQQFLDGDIPLFGGDGSAAVWALLNLALAFAGAVLGIAMLIVAVVRKRRKNGRDENETNAADSEEDKKRKKMRSVGLVVSILLGIAGVIAFLLTEDMSNMVVWMDGWTLLMVGIFITEVVCAVFSGKRRKKNQEKKDMAGRAHAAHELGV